MFSILVLTFLHILIFVPVYIFFSTLVSLRGVVNLFEFNLLIAIALSIYVFFFNDFVFATEFFSPDRLHCEKK